MTHSTRARRLFHFSILPLGVAFLAACSSEDHRPRAPGGREGELAIYNATLEDGTNERRFFLRQGEDETRLVFNDQAPDVSPGTAIEVWGKDQDDGLHVTRLEANATVGTATESLIGGMTYTARKFAFIFVDIGGGVNLTSTDAKKRLFGTNAGDNSVKQYYLEASYNTQDISGDVYGPIKYSMSGCNTSGLASALKGMIPMSDHYLWYLGSRNSSCGWSGLAEEGTPSRPQNDTWYNASAGCVVLVQEPGHNFGLQHSSSMTCGTSVFVDTPQGTCTHSEYGDRYDPMGGGCNHMNAWQKVHEGWLQKCNAVRLKSSGTYTLFPIEAQCNGPQVLGIPMPKVRSFTRSGGGGTSTNEMLAYYYLELRTSRGFDTTIRNTPTVLVHVAEDLRDRSQPGRHTWILDMDRSTTSTIDGLGAGKSFTDPAGGVQFTVQSLTADSAQINVTIPNGTGDATCFDGTPLPNPPPTECQGIVVAPGTGGAGGMGGMGGASGMSGQGGMGGTSGQPPAVEQLVLVNTDTDMDMMPITEASTLNLDVLPPNLTARADTDPPVVGSVVLQVDNGQPRIENTAPYSINPHLNPVPTDLSPWMLALGSHTVTATPFSGPNATGTPGAPLTVTFTLSRASAMNAGGAAGAPGFAGAPVFGAGGFPTGAGGFVSAGAAPGAAGYFVAGAAGTFFGAAGYAGFNAAYAGAPVDDGSSAATSCGCRLEQRPSSSRAALALGALGAALALRRRRARR